MKKYLPICAALVLILGCTGGNSGTGPSGGGNWFPVATGNFWDYVLSGTAQISGVSYTCGGTATIEIQGTATHDGGFTVYSYEIDETLIYLLGGSPVDTFYVSDAGYFRVESDGISEYGSISDSTGYMFLEFPLADGNTWIPSSDDPYGLYEVLSITSDISVPHGNYTGCAEVRYTNSQDPYYYTTEYWAPGIGLGEKFFSIEDSSDTDYVYYTWELSDTNL